MTVQISLRLDGDTVDWVDHLVSSGTYRSRAAAFEAMAKRERSREADANDRRILASTGPDPVLEDWAANAAEQDWDLD